MASMSNPMNRRVAALEDKSNSGAGKGMKVFLLPKGLTDAEEAQWHAENVEPVKADGFWVTVVRFVEPPASHCQDCTEVRLPG